MRIIYNRLGRIAVKALIKESLSKAITRLDLISEYLQNLETEIF